MREVDPENKLSDIVMFDGALYTQLGSRLLKVHYPKLTFMQGVEHTVSLFFNDMSKIKIVHQMLYFHNVIYNIFGSSIYHKPHFMFKWKSQEFHNKNIGIFSGNDTRMSGYFMGMHREFWMKCFFNQSYCMQNSTLLLQIKNSPKQLGTLIIISCGKGDI